MGEQPPSTASIEPVRKKTVKKTGKKPTTIIKTFIPVPNKKMEELPATVEPFEPVRKKSTEEHLVTMEIIEPVCQKSIEEPPATMEPIEPECKQSNEEPLVTTDIFEPVCIKSMEEQLVALGTFEPVHVTTEEEQSALMEIFEPICKKSKAKTVALESCDTDDEDTMDEELVTIETLETDDESTMDAQLVTLETFEPARKKSKRRETLDHFIDSIMRSRDPIQVVLSDEYLKTLPMVKVYVGQVKDIKTLSKIVLILNEKIPLKELSHLKRVYRKEVLLFPLTYPTDLSHEALRDYLEQHASEILDSFEYFRTIDVPSIAPKIKKQYAEWCRTWSCIFHPDKALEKLISPQVFNEEELSYHRLYMGMAFEVARYYLSQNNEDVEPCDILSADLNATIIVDPSIQSVVAIAFDNREEHPMQHSAMIAIDNVAKTQKGGAWEPIDDDDYKLRGIDKDLLEHLRSKFPIVNFGSKDYFTKEELKKKKAKVASECPYLCTGYFVYLIREPCLMCSMGLVHARSNKVFFFIKHELGALTSKTKLQCVPALNHHFEVFTEFL